MDISSPAIAFWGESGRPGQEKGNKVENYIQWLIKSLMAIPVLSKKCSSSSNVILNTEEIKKLTGEYLPVFDGVELSSDWKSFFKFRTKLHLADYLVSDQ